MNNRQSGFYTVEFALVAALFLLLLLSVIEFGRALFVWNTLAEVTRRGARLAVVCPMGHASIANVAVFNAPGSSGSSSVLPGLNSGDVLTQYLNEAGGVADEARDVRYVRVSITGYQHTLLIPQLLPGLPEMTVDAPEFETTLPSESLGCVPDPESNGNCIQQCP